MSNPAIGTANSFIELIFSFPTESRRTISENLENVSLLSIANRIRNNREAETEVEFGDWRLEIGERRNWGFIWRRGTKLVVIRGKRGGNGRVKNAILTRRAAH